MAKLRAFHFTPGDLLSLIHECPLCKEQYGDKDLSVVEREGDQMTVHATCHACGQSLMALVSKNAIGVSSIAARTDFTRADARKFSGREAVTEEDLFNMLASFQKNTNVFL